MPDERITRTVSLLPPAVGGAEVDALRRRRGISSFITVAMIHHTDASNHGIVPPPTYLGTIPTHSGSFLRGFVFARVLEAAAGPARFEISRVYLHTHPRIDYIA